MSMPLRTKPSGLYRHRRGLGLYILGYRERNLHIRSPSLPSTPRKVLSGNGTKSSILYLHSLGVRPKVIVRPSGHPLIQDSLNGIDRILYIVVHPMRPSWNMWEPTWVSRSPYWLLTREMSRSCLHDSRTRRVYTLKVR